jgi:two-component system response regulator FlrC
VGENSSFIEPSTADDLKANERDLILSTLRDLDGNRKLTSEKLGISARTLRYKLAKYKDEGISIPDAAAA